MFPRMLMMNRSRSGFTSTELVVAASLMVATMAIIAPLAFRTSRLWHDTRHQQLAMEALSAELERLTALDPDIRRQQIENLTPSESLLLAAPDAKLSAAIVENEDGTQLVVSLDWNQPNTSRAPLKLVGWLDPLPQEKTP